MGKEVENEKQTLDETKKEMIEKVDQLEILEEEENFDDIEKTEQLEVPEEEIDEIKKDKEVENLDNSETFEEEEKLDDVEKTEQFEVTKEEEKENQEDSQPLEETEKYDENPFEKTMIEEQGYSLSSETNDYPKKKRRKKKIIPIIIAIILLALAGVFVAYKMYFSNSKRIISSAITKFSEKLENSMNYNPAYDVGDNYTLTSDFDIDVESDYLQALSTTSIDYLPYANLINNISNLDTKVTVEIDKKNKEALVNLISNIHNSELMNYKLFLQNDKQYMLIKGLSNKYIDIGDSELFELLENNDQSVEDNKYVYNLIVDSVKKNLKNSYFESKNVKVKINGKEKSVRKVSLILNNSNMKELMNHVLEDLKKDKKANKILTALTSDFKNATIDESEAIFGTDGEVYFNVYVNKMTYKELMYEIETVDDSQNIKLNYVENTAKNTDRMELIMNNITQGVLIIKSKDKTTDISILDGKNNNLGAINIVKNKNNVVASFTSEYEGFNFIMSVSSELKEIKANKEYKQNTLVNVKLTTQGMNLLSMKVENNATITQGTKIKEDITDAITDTSSIDFDTYLTNILERLMTEQKIG